MNCSMKLIFTDDEGNRFFGKGPVMLLKGIDRLHSINKAASEMFLSYYKALKIIKNAEEGFGFPLLKRTSGGKNGGGSVLTDEARELIRLYDTLEKETGDFLNKSFDRIFCDFTKQVGQKQVDTDR